MKRSSFRRYGQRRYRLDAVHAMAFVFGAERWQLWGWVVYSHGKKTSGVEETFLRARGKALRVVRELTESEAL